MDAMSVVTRSLLDLGVEEEAIREDKFFKKDFELDSTETIQIALDLKRHMNIDFKWESKQDMTVRELVALVRQLAVVQPTAAT